MDEAELAALDFAQCQRPSVVKKVVALCLARGMYEFPGYCLKRLEERGLTINDCINCMRGGRVLEGEWEKGAYRYRIETPLKMHVVVELQSGPLTVVVTAYGKKNR